MPEHLSVKSKYKTMVVLGISVALSGIMLNLQNHTDWKNGPFKHPYFQVLMMYIGESLGWIFYGFHWRYLCKKYGGLDASIGYVQAQANGMNLKINRFIFMFPASLDYLASTLFYISIANIGINITQMLVGADIIIMALVSVVFYKEKIYRHHVVGLIFQFIGVLIPCMFALFDREILHLHITMTNAIVGVITCFLSDIFLVLQYWSQKYILSTYYTHYTHAIGMEGVWGIIFTSLILVCLQFIPWPDEAMCSGEFIEDSLLAIKQIFTSWSLGMLVLAYVIFTYFFNSAKVKLNQYESLMLSLTVKKSRTFTIWLFFIFYTNGGHKEFNYYDLLWNFLLLFGILIYNEIFVFTCCDMNKYTRMSLARASYSNQYNALMQRRLSSNGTQESSALDNQNMNGENPENSNTISNYNAYRSDDMLFAPLRA